MKSLAVLAVLAAVTLLALQPAFAQPSDELKALRQEVEALKAGQAEIQKELQELKNFLRGRAAPPPAEPQNVVLAVDGAPVMGEQTAKVTLVEFSDYQCPFCSRHFAQTLPQIVKEYVKTGKVRYVLRDFPIESIHPQAFKAHEAAHCAGAQGKYWEMHDRLFANPKALALPDLSRHAQALGLDLSAFQPCLESGQYAAKVRKDLADGQQAGVTGTPSFFLGVTEPSDGKVKVLRRLRGAQPYASFKEAIDSLLASQKD